MISKFEDKYYLCIKMDYDLNNDTKTTIPRDK